YVDAIYVATPHSLHHANTLLALQHGKHVLCEKPFAINAAQAQEMVDAARSAGLFLMEAMWTRFLPIMVETRRLIAEGAIGKVQMIQADFGFRASFNPASRLFDPALGGGALLDVGVYPISLASMLLGRPDRIAAVATLGATGIDENTGVLLGFPG
ncbi:MAG: dehydrogenase, partial [Candidatus Thermofonsia Clade 3 bacterium]